VIQGQLLISNNVSAAQERRERPPFINSSEVAMDGSHPAPRLRCSTIPPAVGITRINYSLGMCDSAAEVMHLVTSASNTGRSGIHEGIAPWLLSPNERPGSHTATGSGTGSPHWHSQAAAGARRGPGVDDAERPCTALTGQRLTMATSADAMQCFDSSMRSAAKCCSRTSSRLLHVGTCTRWRCGQVCCCVLPRTRPRVAVK
jgi:hypothetical protein